MERYQEYKDSGIYFIGTMPSHWKQLRAKYLFKQEKRSVRPQDDIITCFRDGQVTLRKNRRVDGFTNSEKEIGYQGIRVNDLVIHNMDAFAGAIGISDADGKSTPVYAVCTPRANCVNVYYYCYLLRSLARDGLILSLAKGIRERSTDFRFSDFKELVLPIPTTEEQEKIVNYIDRSAVQIDKAIAQQQRMIDLLNERKQIIIQHAVTKGLDPNAEMVDSGVEWIGEMPKGWSVYKLKHICNAFGRIGFRGYSTSDLVEENEGAITLSPSNMKDGGMTYEKCTYLSWKKYEESSEIKIHDGDIIFVKTGSSYGKSSIVYGLPKEATINPQLLVFKDIRCSREFLSYVLMTNSIRNQIETSVIGGTIPTISQNKILNFSFTCPSKGEQENIVCKLGELINPIKSSIKKIEKRISFLRERKQIIINEVVTGKVKVS